jgi:hypothetical protein
MLSKSGWTTPVEMSRRSTHCSFRCFWRPQPRAESGNQRCGQRHIPKRCLSDTRLAAHHEHDALPRPHSVTQPVEPRTLAVRPRNTLIETPARKRPPASRELDVGWGGRDGGS